MPRLSSALVVATSLLALAACSDSDDPAGDSADPSPTTEGASSADVCSELTDAGYTGADFGPVATWESPDAVRERVDHLASIVDLPAPQDLSAEWEVRLGYVERLQTMLDDSGGAALDPAAAMATPQEDAAAETLTDWWFDSCQ